MVNFRPNDGDAATEADKKLNAGLFYKHRTHSQDAIEQVSAAIDGSAKDISVYHYERYLPVFSSKYFETKGIADAAADYHYFYQIPNGMVRLMQVMASTLPMLLLMMRIMSSQITAICIMSIRLSNP